MGSFSPDSLLLPHRVWKVKFVGESCVHSGRVVPRVGSLWPGMPVPRALSGRTSGRLSLLLGESVDDCGGGYSESIAEICEELQNGLTPLLIVTPNGRDESGANRDCYLFSPAARAPVHTNMFRFLGAPLSGTMQARGCAAPLASCVLCLGRAVDMPCVCC